STAGRKLRRDRLRSLKPLLFAALLRSDRRPDRVRRRFSRQSSSVVLTDLQIMSFSIAMVAACPFPANHGTPAAIKEMSEELARRGHSGRGGTYSLSPESPNKGGEVEG